ncbi:hypothetical protein Ancab_022317 [Ancistrocladus abbreviatus]
MKVHPAPKKRNITLRCDIASPLAEANRLLPCRQQKLRRLPHIFAKVLELPFHSDADVSIEETDEYFRFTVSDTDVSDDVRADTIEIYPGVTKIVLRSNEVVYLSIDEMELDLWRFRLPASTRPELATASYVDGDLVVTVPKGVEEEEDELEIWSELGFGHLRLFMPKGLCLSNFEVLMGDSWRMNDWSVLAFYMSDRTFEWVLWLAFERDDELSTSLTRYMLVSQFVATGRDLAVLTHEPRFSYWNMVIEAGECGTMDLYISCTHELGSAIVRCCFPFHGESGHWQVHIRAISTLTYLNCLIDRIRCVHVKLRLNTLVWLLNVIVSKGFNSVEVDIDLNPVGIGLMLRI